MAPVHVVKLLLSCCVNNKNVKNNRVVSGINDE